MWDMWNVCIMYIYYYYGLGANDSNQAKGGTALGNEPDDEVEKVGGDEAMEPNLESLGRSRGGDDDDEDEMRWRMMWEYVCIYYYYIIIVLMGPR